MAEFEGASSGIMSKRIGPVRVVWLIPMIIVGALVYLAVQSRKSTGSDPAEVDQAEVGTDDAVNDGGGADYSHFTNTGGFAANPAPTYDTSAEVADTTTVETNETWARKAVLYLTQRGHSAGESQLAIQHYMAGSDLSYSEGQLRDDAVAHFGPPPEMFDIGTTAGKPAAPKPVPTQGQLYTVTGTSDNTADKLIMRAYGVTKIGADMRQKIAAANANLPSKYGPWPVGTKVMLPIFKATRYYTTRRGIADEKFSQIAAKNGTTVAALHAMNPKLHEPIRTGTKVQVA